MAISTKTRKQLWGKSGNACAICKQELIKSGGNGKISITIGEECHIVSSKSKGPRFEKGYSDDHDDYRNLLLLCRNHHKEIDSDIKSYPKEKLLQLKTEHENWVESTLRGANSKRKRTVHELIRIKEGKELVDIIKGAYGTITDYSPPKTKEEAELIGVNLEYIIDHVDLFGMKAIDKTEELKITIDFQNRLDELKSQGFLMFAKSVKIKVKYKKKNSEETWNVPVVLIKRETNDLIGKEFILAILNDIKLF